MYTSEIDEKTNVEIPYKVNSYNNDIKKEVEIDSQNDDSLGADFYEIDKLKKEELSEITILELEKLEIIKVLDYNINKWGEIKVVNSDMEREYYKFDKDNSELIVCKNCGELYEEEDVVNKFYIRNFGVDKNCFEEIILK